MEMPRCCSMAIQSDVAARLPRRAFTAPASCTAPPYSRNFSVSVVLPASGWEMIANVRRRAISSDDFMGELLLPAQTPAIPRAKNGTRCRRHFKRAGGLVLQDRSADGSLDRGTWHP